MLLITYLISIGFISILGQSVLLRELSVAAYGIDLIYTLALGIWLFFSACGTILGSRFRVLSFSRLKILFLLVSISTPIDLAFIRSSRLIFAGTPGAYLPLLSQIIILIVSLLPMGILLGLQFQWAARLYVSKNNGLASAYALECVGGIAGGICATLFLKAGLSNYIIALLCAFVAAIMTFLNQERGNARRLYPFSIIITTVLMLLLWKSHDWDYLWTSWTHPNLLETKDSPYSRITSTFRNGQVSVFENDSLIFDTESTEAEEFVHPAALQCRNPKKVLILGGGIEGLVYEVQKYMPKSIDYVEINPVLIDRVVSSLPLNLQKSLHQKNVRIILEDPRHYLSRAHGYDLILVGMPEPSSGQTNRFYTQEFFQLCRAGLTEQGVLALRLRSSENYWTPLLTRRMSGIYRAAESIFPEIIFLPGSTNILMGSITPMTTEISLLASRLESRKILTRLISPQYLRYLYTNDRFRLITQTLKNSLGDINTDKRPICYQYTILIWLSKFIPSIAFWDNPFSCAQNIRILFYWLLFLLPLLFLRAFRWLWRRAFLVAIMAFSGMVLEIVLLLHFQTQNGILYQDIGILLTAYMAGLALGAATLTKINQPNTKLPGIMMLAGFAILSSVVGWRIQSGSSSGLLETSFLLILSGLLPSGIFAYACLRLNSDQNKAIASLYTADLLGGCLGSILACLFLIPLAGLSITAFLMAGFAIVSLLLI
jgi:spermidine synthase